MNSQELKLLRNTMRLPYKNNYGATQKEMADLLGVSLITYSRYERGEKTISKPVAMLAEKLKL